MSAEALLWNALVMLAVVGLPACSVLACTAVVVGRRASADGSVLLGHNEQNGGGGRFLNFRKVPRITHKPGRKVTLRGGAKVPQVRQTAALLWSENPGLVSSDGYLNEWGVAVVSNVPDVHGETWLAVSAEGKCQRWPKAPVLVKEWDWDHLVCSGSAAYWVLENNKVWRMDLLRVTKDGQQAHGDVVALISDRDSHIVFVSTDDKVVVNDLTQKSLSRKEFEVWPTVIKDAKAIKIAVGLRPGDKLLLVSQGIGDPFTYKMVMLDGDNLQTSWRGKSKGRRPHRLRRLVRAMRVPADAAIWTGAWSAADEWELDTVYELAYDGVKADNFFTTPVPCVVLMDNGERNHVTDIDVLKALLESGKAVQVFPE